MKEESGYIGITREWKKGDKINLSIPMEIQKITADDNQSMGTTPLKPEWRPDLFGGIMTIKGTWADGTPLVAIPNYIRNNRIGTTPPVAVSYTHLRAHETGRNLVC